MGDFELLRNPHYEFEISLSLFQNPQSPLEVLTPVFLFDKFENSYKIKQIYEIELIFYCLNLFIQTKGAFFRIYIVCLCI